MVRCTSISVALVALGLNAGLAEEIMAPIHCTGTQQAMDHAQYAALCEALGAALAAVDAPALNARFTAIGDHAVHVTVSNSADPDSAGTALVFGLTDTTISARHHQQFAASIVGSARHFGLIPSN